MIKKTVSNIFLTVLGLMLILWSAGLPLLGLIGEKDIALITHVRKQGGERNEAIPNRYTYVISYEFKLPDESIKDGFTYKIGDYTRIYGLPSTNTVPIRYLKTFPQINALEVDTIPSLEKLIVFGVGFFLAFKRGSKPNRKETKAGLKKEGGYNTGQTSKE